VSSIEFARVTRRFQTRNGEVAALEDVSLEVADKEFVAIVGPSGCGKTTLLRLAAGLEAPTAGSVQIDGRTIREPGPDRAVVFQQFALFPWKTVRENIAFGLECIGRSRADCNRAITRYVELMGLEGREESYPHQLSGGMQQRVAIARSYAVDPQVLLMDEPFGALDAQTRIVMQEELIRLARLNPRTVIFITHSVEEAVYLADRVAVMTGRPGCVREIVDVKTVRSGDGWDQYSVDEVMERMAFVRLRTQIWKLLRS